MTILKEVRDDYAAALQSALKLPFRKGECMSWESLESCFGFKRHSTEFDYLLRQLKKSLREKPYELVARARFPDKPLTGLWILSSREIAGKLPQVEQRKVLRRVRRLKGDLENGIAGASDHERKIIIANISNLSLQKTSTISALRRAHILAKPSSGGDRHLRPLCGNGQTVSSQ